MASTICIPDNRHGWTEDYSESQWEDLRFIAGKKVSALQYAEGEDGTSLLVFPEKLNKYGDKLGDSLVLDIHGRYIDTGNLMGFIGRRDTLLKIFSRFDNSENDFFMHYMLERVFAVNLFDLPHSTDSDQVFNFVLFLFPYFLKRAMAQGLYRQYKTYRRNDANVRGAIDIARHIRTNVPFFGRIAYNSREHTADNDLVELIRHTVEFIRNKPFGQSILSRDEETRLCVVEIVQATPEYTPRERQRILFKNLRPRVHPYFSEYEPLRRLCIQILQEEEIKYGKQDDRVYGVLFDGAWLWEEYLNTMLERLDFVHPENKLNRGAIHLFTQERGPRYPDFYNESLVLDAKYKRYQDKCISQINREDIAQVISYMYVLKSQIGGILVPGKESVSAEYESLLGHGGRFYLLTLPIPQSALTYEAFCAQMKDNESAFSQVVEGLTASVLA